MNTSSHHQLKTCPFCEGSARFGVVNNDPDLDGDSFGGEFISCEKCGASTPLLFPIHEDVKVKLADAWNRRARTFPSITRIEELRHLIIEALFELGGACHDLHEIDDLCDAALRGTYSQRPADGFAVVQPDGHFVGIWRTVDTARSWTARSSAAKGEVIKPMHFADDVKEVPTDIAGLMTFYAVDTERELIAAQDGHVTRLQEKLAALHPPEAVLPLRPREG